MSTLNKCKVKQQQQQQQQQKDKVKFNGFLNLANNECIKKLKNM